MPPGFPCRWEGLWWLLARSPWAASINEGCSFSERKNIHFSNVLGSFFFCSSLYFWRCYWFIFMHNTRWQKNYTTKTYPLFLAAQSRDLRSEAETICGCMRSDQPTWPICFWQGTGCSDSKTYASKILSLRFLSFFALSLSAQLHSLLIFLPHCIHVAAGRQSLQGSCFEMALGADAPTGAGTPALCASGSWRVWGKAWALALSRARWSRLRGSGGWAGSAGRCCPPWLRQTQQDLVFKERPDHGWVLASLEALLHRLWDSASSFLSPWLAGVSALPTCLLPWMLRVPQDALTLNKAAAPALSFHVVKSVNSGYRNTALNFR